MTVPFDLDAYLVKHPVIESAEKLIREAFIAPSRDVGGTPYPAVVTEFQSDKMMVSVSTESSTGELAFAIQLDLDNSVEGFCEQLPPVDCLRTDKRGRKVLRTYRADFLVLHKDGPYVVQVKTADEVTSLIERYPTDWIRSGNAVVDLPARSAFEALGLPHVVVLDTDMPATRIANLRTLLRVRSYAVDQDVAVSDQVCQLLDKQSAVRICDVLGELGLKDATPLLKLVLEGKIFADLDRQLLTCTESCLISGDRRILCEVIDSKLAVGFTAPQGDVSIESAPTKEAANESMRRIDLLEAGDKSRATRRWRALIKANGSSSPFLVLLPKYHRSGNRLAKRPASVLDFARESVRKHWANAQRPSPRNAHREYEVEARSVHPGFKPVSMPTYSKLIEQEKRTLAQARGGRRAANALSSPSQISKRSIRATRPFEHAQVDHCLAKIYCEIFRTEERSYVAKVWLTALRDTKTGEVLARWASFSRPSRIAVAMVIRSCLRRHGRLPEAISVDKGSEFLSVYLSELAAHYGFHLPKRPTAHSRFGGSIERLFGLFRSLWLDRRPGNCTDIKQVRSLTGSHHPRNMKCMRLPDFLRELDEFCSWLLHEKVSLDTTPHLARKEGLERFPFSGLIIPYDDAFIVATAVDYGKLSIDGSRGIKINDEHYWHPELRHFETRGRLPVRIEPEDHTCIYVKLGDHWVTAKSSRNSILAAGDEAARLAESLIIMDGRELKKEAREDADTALVQLWKKADAMFAAQTDGSETCAEEVPKEDEKDVWSMIRSNATKGLQTSSWRTGT